MSYRIFVLAICCLCFAHTARGEDKPKNTKTRSKAARKLASADSEAKFANLKATADAPKSRKEWTLTLGVLAGLATASSNVIEEDQARSASGYGQNIYLGIQGDFRYGRYLGAEWDAFYNIAPSKAFQGSTTTTASLRQYGGLVDVKGRYAFRAGEGVIVTPKVGLGFGALGLVQTLSSGTAEASANTKAQGVYGVVGTEARVTKRVTISVDYLMSVGASGSSVISGGTSPDQDVEIESGSFDRFRLGVAYRVSVPVSVGAQFVRRALKYSQTGETIPTQETMNQFLATALFHF